MLFQHGYALIVGVGRSAYPAWSLPTTASDAAALRAIDAQRLLVFIDSCHAAGMATAKDAATLELPGQFSQTALPKGLADALKEGQGRAVFASSRGEQRSWLRPNRTLSLYTHHLLEALHGAGSRPGDEVVRLSHLAAHLSRTAPDSARRLCAAEQTPFYDWSSEDFPVALLRGGKGLPAEGWQAGEALAQPPAAPTYSATLTGSGAIAQDDSAAAGAGGIAIGRVGHK